MAKVIGGKVKSLKTLKASVKRGGGGGADLTRHVPKEGITVRFLAEPDDGWVEYLEHYDEQNKVYRACTDDCAYCADDVRRSKRYLAPVLVPEEQKIEALKLPATAVSQLLKKYDRFGTLLDRDYEITKDGEGMSTEYYVDNEDPRRINLSRYQIPDLEEILEKLAGAPAGDDDEDDDEEERPKRRPAKKAAAKRRSRDDDDEDDADNEDETPWDDEDADEDEEDEEFLRPRRGARAVKPKAKTAITKARSSEAPRKVLRKPSALRKR